MWLLIVVLLAVAAAALAQAYRARLFVARRLERHVTVGHLVRRYVVWLPPSRGKKSPLPVVLAFHPGYATPEGFEDNIALHAAGEARNFIIVYPEGYQRSWNAGTCCGAALRDKIDEKKFVHAILDDLESISPIDRCRVYATGHSNGARLCYFLACTMSEEIAAIAPVGGAAGAVVSPQADCRPTRPVAVFHLHGLEDKWAPYRGGPGLAPKVPSEAPVEAGIAFWRHLAGTCTEARQEMFGGLADCIIYSGAKDGTKIQLCRIAGLGHHWPGTRMRGGYQRMAALLGPLPPISLDDVNDAILQFLGAFRTHSPSEGSIGIPPGGSRSAVGSDHFHPSTIS
jgi:polyhydroxybutyrate depolymerase